MNEDIQESIENECKDIMHWTNREERAKKASTEAEDRLLDLIEEHCKDQLPIDDNFAEIKIGEYEVCVSNHRNKYNSILYVEKLS